MKNIQKLVGLIKKVLAVATKTTASKIVTGVIALGLIGGGTAAIISTINSNTSSNIVSNEEIADKDEQNDESVDTDSSEPTTEVEDTQSDKDLNNLEEQVENGEITQEEFDNKLNDLKSNGKIDDQQIAAAKHQVSVAEKENKKQEPVSNPESQPRQENVPSTSDNSGQVTPPANKEEIKEEAPKYMAAGTDSSLTSQLNSWIEGTYSDTGLPRYGEVVSVCQRALNGEGIPDWLQNGYDGGNGIRLKYFGKNNASISADEKGDLSPQNLIINSRLLNNSAVTVGGHYQSNIYYCVASHDGNGHLIVKMEQLYVGLTN